MLSDNCNQILIVINATLSKLGAGRAYRCIYLIYLRTEEKFLCQIDEIL
jgi:hypothetical protein